MHFTFTPSAVEQLSEQIKDDDRSLRLMYDTEGCGCAVNGVPTLQLIKAPAADNKLGEGDPFSVWYDPNDEVFFEPSLRIDFDKSRHAFSLKSDNQIYTTNLRLLKEDIQNVQF
ncbi:iron-sulfur cluster biosynthesis family protein [Paenibacillus sepulcri]|uniref:Iron-sulfur cluster biosynthesis family protein n=1 Tax=Paenibacillus sepulcri TaxID=359917 RepID=A0ABS7C6H0_9BACL|nr:iron-sulfur cluster biosynthesis family protein [Paenibacillus sepulcri]